MGLYRPWLFFFRAFGVLTMFISLVLTLFALYHKIVTGRAVTAWTSQLVAISFFAGVNLLGIGIIGEYVARVYDEVKQRPFYIVDRVTGEKSGTSE